MNKGTILCFAPRSGDVPLADPCALLCATRLLIRDGYGVKIVQSEKGKDFTREILDHAVGAIAFGVSCITSHAIHEAISATEKFRIANPTAPIIWGGWHPSIMPKETLSGHPAIDAVVVGQGERSFLELVELRNYRPDWKHIKGVRVRDGGGEPRPLEDVNNFGPLPYHLVDVEKNLRVSRFGKRTIRIASSQGCPHRCGFCVEPTVFHRRWSGRKAESVLDEIESLIDSYRIDSVIFTDSNFFTDPKRVLEFARGLKERGIAIKWGDCNGRTHQLLKMPKETWAELASSGLTSILIGAESGSDEALKLIKKDCTVQETVDLAKLANSYGISVCLSMMVGLPYAGKTHAELAETTRREFSAAVSLIDLVQRNNSGVWNGFLLFDYTPYPGTPLYRNAIALGVSPPRTLRGWAAFELNNHALPWIPKDVSFKAEMLSAYVFFWLGGNALAQMASKGFVFHAIGLVFNTICRWRWKLRFFALPLDFLAYRWALKFWKP